MLPPSLPQQTLQDRSPLLLFPLSPCCPDSHAWRRCPCVRPQERTHSSSDKGSRAGDADSEGPPQQTSGWQTRSIADSTMSYVFLRPAVCADAFATYDCMHLRAATAAPARVAVAPLLPRRESFSAPPRRFFFFPFFFVGWSLSRPAHVRRRRSRCSGCRCGRQEGRCCGEEQV